MKAAEKPITLEQTDEIISHLTRMLRRRLKGMLFNQAQALVGHPHELIVGPVTAALFESCPDDGEPRVDLVQQDIFVAASGEYHPLDCFSDESMFTFDLAGDFSLAGFQGTCPQPAQPSRRVFSYRARNRMLRFDEAISFCLGTSEKAALGAVQNLTLSLRQVEELVRRSDKGEYTLTRRDGIGNFFFVEINGGCVVCGITRRQKEMKWEVVLYNVRTARRFTNAQYFI